MIVTDQGAKIKQRAAVDRGEGQVFTRIAELNRAVKHLREIDPDHGPVLRAMEEQVRSCWNMMYEVQQHRRRQHEEARAIERAGGVVPPCRRCGCPLELSSDLIHYIDTGMLCDGCFADDLGIEV